MFIQNFPIAHRISTVLGLRDARPAGWDTFGSTEYSICASTMPRAQNRAAKGSIMYCEDD